MKSYDVIVVGGGPSGSLCAAYCAKAGLKTLLLEKTPFPREKVCGDCVNPSAWSVLERLGVAELLLEQKHATMDTVNYIGAGNTTLSVALPPSATYPRIAIKRSVLDACLVKRAVELGAEFFDGIAVESVQPGWKLETALGALQTRFLIAADGRNSTIARQLNLLPASQRNRIGLQAHIHEASHRISGVSMFFFPLGYGGLAPVDEETINLCLVARHDRAAALRDFATHRFGLKNSVSWRALTPISRGDARMLCQDGLFLVGDAARVVEPFTGEGIYYALRSGELAAQAVIQAVETNNPARADSFYRQAHQRLYRGRLWINRLSRVAGENPLLTSGVLQALKLAPHPVEYLTRRVMQS